MAKYWFFRNSQGNLFPASREGALVVLAVLVLVFAEGTVAVVSKAVLQGVVAWIAYAVVFAAIIGAYLWVALAKCSPIVIGTQEK